ncbi:MAG TPA: hypothetical protein VFQ00_07905 [Terriglobales bacterium]|nr:hypothetical protein [Terriglobales bacterium]
MIRRAFLLLFVSAIAASAQQTDAHHAGVVARGDHVMGFSHEQTVHHFQLTTDGGIIEALASDSADAKSREEIHTHFEHIATMFASGDFNAPMLIHDHVPPGVSTMKKLRKQISYRVQDEPNGSRISISSGNPEAVKAIHNFLRFQIQDHQTGDSIAITN